MVVTHVLTHCPRRTILTADVAQFAAPDPNKSSPSRWTGQSNCKAARVLASRPHPPRTGSLASDFRGPCS